MLLTGDDLWVMLCLVRLIESFALWTLGAAEAWTLGLWRRLIPREPLTAGGMQETSC